MKIDNDRLKALYQAHPGSKRPASRKDCPSAKALTGVLRSRSSAGRATAIIDHLSRCAGCASEFGFLLEARRSEDALLRDIDQWLSGTTPEESRIRNQGDVLAPRKRGRPSSPLFSWRAFPLIIGLFVVAFVISTRLIFHSPERYRAEAATRVESLQPAGTTVARAALVFRWKRVPQSEYYVLRLFDQALAPIWQSDRLRTASLPLPPAVTAKLRDNDSYFWMVTAHLSDGQDIKSTLEEFVVKP